MSNSTLLHIDHQVFLLWKERRSDTIIQTLSKITNIIGEFYSESVLKAVMTKVSEEVKIFPDMFFTKELREQILYRIKGE